METSVIPVAENLPNSMVKSRSLDDLSTDVLILIFEELYNTWGPSAMASDAFQSLRLISRKMNMITTPFRYRQIQLSPKLLENPMGSSAILNVIAHTRHLVVTRPLDWELVARVLSASACIQSLTWRYDERTWQPFPTAIRSLVVSKRLRLKIDKLDNALENLDSIPASQVVDIRVDLHDEDFLLVNNFLVESKNLESLSLCSIDQWPDPDVGRLAPIQTLRVSSFGMSWPYSAEETDRLWDFSRLKHLEVTLPCLHRFLLSVAPHKFVHLKKLEMSEVFEHQDHQAEVTKLLGKLVESAQCLEEIAIPCFLDHFDFSSILKHRSLQALKLRKFQEPDPEDEPTIRRTLSVQQLHLLQSSCPFLRRLDLDINLKECEPYQFIDAVAQFRNLDSLKLTTLTLLDENEENNEGRDVDLEFFQDAIMRLQDHKCGRPMLQVTVHIRTLEYSDTALAEHLAFHRRLYEIDREPRVLIFNWRNGKIRTRSYNSSHRRRYRRR